MAKTAESTRTKRHKIAKEEALTPCRQEETITESSGNVFADLGFENPEEELAKAKLVVALSKVIEQTGLTQTKVAEILGVDQPTISKLLRGRTNGFTSDRLMRLLNLLGQDIDISVRPKRTQEAHINISVAQLI
jgi:predicted XRE-type DNA-binding protein